MAVTGLGRSNDEKWNSDSEKEMVWVEGYSRDWTELVGTWLDV